MKKKKQVEYYGGRIKLLAEQVAKMVAIDLLVGGRLAYDARNDDFSLLHTMLARLNDGYGKKDRCFNCKRPMEITIFTCDRLTALLLIRVAEKVRQNLREGMDFTEANQVRVQDLNASMSIKLRPTWGKYLGLMRQVESQNHKGIWLITGWGWKLLRGEPVPKSARYWDRKLLKRSEETTTLAEMLGNHPELKEYSPQDWTEFGGYIEDEPALE